MLSALSAACDVFCKLQMPTKVEVARVPAVFWGINFYEFSMIFPG